MYLLNLVKQDNGQRVTVPMWDSEWSAAEQAVVEKSSNRVRHAMFLVGLLGITHQEASSRALRLKNEPARVRVESIQVRGRIVYTEDAHPQARGSRRDS